MKDFFITYNYILECISVGDCGDKIQIQKHTRKSSELICEYEYFNQRFGCSGTSDTVEKFRLLLHFVQGIFSFIKSSGLFSLCGICWFAAEEWTADKEGMQIPGWECTDK